MADVETRIAKLGDAMLSVEQSLAEIVTLMEAQAKREAEEPKEDEDKVLDRARDRALIEVLNRLSQQPTVVHVPAPPPVAAPAPAAEVEEPGEADDAEGDDSEDQPVSAEFVFSEVNGKPMGFTLRKGAKTVNGRFTFSEVSGKPLGFTLKKETA